MDIAHNNTAISRVQLLPNDIIYLLFAKYSPFILCKQYKFDRNSKYFKSNYSLRAECERYNSRFKNTGQERMWVRNKSSVTNLNTLAHISLLAVAVAAITSGTGQSYRKLKAAKRTA